MPTPEERLQELGVSLPSPAAPVAAYIPCVRTGNLVYVSGHGPLKADGTMQDRRDLSAATVP